MRLSGRLDRAALLQALDRIVARHEALRTTFIKVDGEPVQRIISAEESGFHLMEHDLQGREDAQAELDRLVALEANTAFDLENGPLIRGRLIRQSEDEHVLLISMHHIVSDGWSMAVWIDELSVLYGAYLRGEGDPLPELAVQYADYAVWQRKWIEGEVTYRGKRFIWTWPHWMQSAPALLELPADHARPAQQDYAGAFARLMLDDDS